MDDKEILANLSGIRFGTETSGAVAGVLAELVEGEVARALAARLPPARHPTTRGPISSQDDLLSRTAETTPSKVRRK